MISLPPLSEWTKGDYAYTLSRGGVALEIRNYGIGRPRWGASVTSGGSTSYVAKSGKSYALLGGRATDAYTHAVYETAGQAKAALSRAMQAVEAHRKNPQETDAERQKRHAETRAYREAQDRAEAAQDARRAEILTYVRRSGKRKPDRFSPTGSYLPRKNPQQAFNPINYGFRWTKDWYEWDAKAATAAAKRDRDATAKALAAKGYAVRKWSNARQLVRRGGIGTGHPEIDEIVTVFMLDVR